MRSKKILLKAVVYTLAAVIVGISSIAGADRRQRVRP